MAARDLTRSPGAGRMAWVGPAGGPRLTRGRSRWSATRHERRNRPTRPARGRCFPTAEDRAHADRTDRRAGRGVHARRERRPAGAHPAEAGHRRRGGNPTHRGGGEQGRGGRDPGPRFEGKGALRGCHQPRWPPTPHPRRPRGQVAGHGDLAPRRPGRAAAPRRGPRWVRPRGSEPHGSGRAQRPGRRQEGTRPRAHALGRPCRAAPQRPRGEGARRRHHAGRRKARLRALRRRREEAPRALDVAGRTRRHGPPRHRRPADVERAQPLGRSVTRKEGPTVSVPVAIARLRVETSRFARSPYLLTVSDDARPHAVAVSAVWEGDALRIAVGRSTAANAAARPGVSLLWPPNEPGGYSLIVDGAAAGTGEPGRITVTPTRAVLHRPAASPEPAKAGCRADCLPILG